MDPLSQLLGALERYTQAVQANTAAVHSLLSTARADTGDREGCSRLRSQIEEQLREGRRVVDRIEQLREQLLKSPESISTEVSHESTRAPHPGR